MNFERSVKAKFKFNLRIGICKVIFEKFNQLVEKVNQNMAEV